VENGGTALIKNTTLSKSTWSGMGDHGSHVILLEYVGMKNES
jgi:hypothetical protein